MWGSARDELRILEDERADRLKGVCDLGHPQSSLEPHYCRQALQPPSSVELEGRSQIRNSPYCAIGPDHSEFSLRKSRSQQVSLKHLDASGQCPQMEQEFPPRASPCH